MTTANCLRCGTTITVTTRNPNRRYCSPRCRKAAWQAHRRTNHRVGDDVANGVGHDVDVVIPVMAYPTPFHRLRASADAPTVDKSWP
jgi:endogenous inhibitor of DNA gyrase (YacG/DUF329 family)